MQGHVLQVPVQEQGLREEEGKLCKQNLWGRGYLALSPQSEEEKRLTHQFFRSESDPLALNIFYNKGCCRDESWIPGTTKSNLISYSNSICSG